MFKGISQASLVHQIIKQLETWLTHECEGHFHLPLKVEKFTHIAPL